MNPNQVLKRIAVLGGGISGLTTAWYIQKAYPEAVITLFEKTDRLGGVMETVTDRGVHFETGPRTFAVSRSSALLALLEELDLSSEILFSSEASAKRYLWKEGSLKSVGSFLPVAIWPLLREVFIPRRPPEDESIYDFCTRRLSEKVATTFFDPITLGIFAGDIRRLSLKSTFPFLYKAEKEGKSLLATLLAGRKKDHRLFTLRRGLSSLIDALHTKLQIDVRLNSPVTAITPEGPIIDGLLSPADWTISALPGPVMGRLTSTWENFPAQSIWVVNLLFSKEILPNKGFGYLAPSDQKEVLLGMVWDSSIFPNEQGPFILTAMIRNQGDAAWAERQALSTLSRHLGVKETPLSIHTTFQEKQIPQFEVGYEKRLSAMQTRLHKEYPRLLLAGNYLDGVSVNCCIRSALRVVDQIFSKGIAIQS